MGAPRIESGHKQYAPRENLAGEWTENITWPGPEGLTVRTTGPGSLLMRWRKIDHETYGNRFFYVVSFRNASQFQGFKMR